MLFKEIANAIELIRCPARSSVSVSRGKDRILTPGQTAFISDLVPYDQSSTHERKPAMSSPANAHITSVLKEKRSFSPPPDFAAAAHFKNIADYERLWQRAKDDPNGFWAEQAESLQWFRRWDKVMVWNEPHAQWFVGGQINASVNCL